MNSNFEIVKLTLADTGQVVHLPRCAITSIRQTSAGVFLTVGGAKTIGVRENFHELSKSGAPPSTDRFGVGGKIGTFNNGKLGS